MDNHEQPTIKFVYFYTHHFYEAFQDRLIESDFESNIKISLDMKIKLRKSLATIGLS